MSELRQNLQPRGNLTGPSVNPNFNTREAPYQYYPPWFQITKDFKMVRKVSQELHGPGLRPLGRSKFHKPIQKC